MHELAFGISSYNTAFYEEHIGVRNSHNIERMAGGSSGGTAAAIGAGIVYGGLGTDTGGSVRIPSALNGIVGFRPTVGRYSQEGITPISHTRDAAGPMAVDVRSVALLDSVISGDKMVTEPAKKEGLRLGVSKSFLKNIEPEIETLWEKAITAFQNAGIVIVEIGEPEIMGLNALFGFPVALYEANSDMRSYLEKYDAGISIEPDQPDERLEELFDRLRTTADPLEAQIIEVQIWRIWIDRGRNDMNAGRDTGI